MNVRRESAVLGIKTQHKAAKGKSKVAVLQEKLKTLEADLALAEKDLGKLIAATNAANVKRAQAEAKVRAQRVKLAAAGG